MCHLGLHSPGGVAEDSWGQGNTGYFKSESVANHRRGGLPQVGCPIALRLETMADQVQAELLDRVRSLVPLLRQHARASEIARHPADAVVAALREAGVFELMVPRSYGGLELDLDSFLEVGLELAAGDASAAWVTCFYIEHNWMLCQFPESFQNQLFQDRTHVLAPASIAPNGVAEPVGSSFRITGRWQWATGIWHGEWVIVGARVESSGPGPRLAFLRCSACGV